MTATCKLGTVALASAMILTIVALPCHGALFEFDLTSEIGAEFTNVPETTINLGMEFASIDSATVKLKGEFTPALVTMMTLPDGIPQVVESGTVNLMIRLDEPGTAWIEKSAFTNPWLMGYRGAIELTLPLRGAEDTPVPTLFPIGEIEPDLSFLLDGQFAVSTGWGLTLASAFQTVENAEFQLTEFILQINGTAVPEPTTGMLTVFAIFALLYRGAIL